MKDKFSKNESSDLRNFQQTTSRSLTSNRSNAIKNVFLLHGTLFRCCSPYRFDCNSITITALIIPTFSASTDIASFVHGSFNVDSLKLTIRQIYVNHLSSFNKKT